MMSPYLGILHIEFFILHGKALQLDDAKEFLPLLPELILSEYHVFTRITGPPPNTTRGFFDLNHPGFSPT